MAVTYLGEDLVEGVEEFREEKAAVSSEQSPGQSPE
jgi:hypothetical protein